MSGGPASYTFLPWLRRGIGRYAQGGSSLAVRIDLQDGRSAEAAIPLLGPGDVVGFDRRVVSRVWPAPDTGEAEPNLLPMIELDQPDLPWRYTAAAAASDRLLPWIALVVVRDEEIASQVPAGGSRPLPAVSIAGAPLPRLEQAWAWAHVQVTGAPSLDADALAEVLRTSPQQALSRILCSRRLQTRARYHALLVPTFDVGRRAGLGQSAEGIDPLALSWAAGADAVDVPIYHRWSFSTGDDGDFETLVGRLRPSVTVGSGGGLLFDAAQPGAGLPPAAREPLIFEGALRPPGFEAPAWPETERGEFIPALATLLNRPADLRAGDTTEAAVAPPLYGQQQADEERLRVDEAPRWFHELNTDPRLRAAAGLGAEVIRREQRDLVAAAWAQAPGVSEVNDALRGAQLAREVLRSVHARHLVSGRGEQLVAMTAPVHARIMGSPKTVASLLREGPLPEAAASGGFRRMTRSGGALARKQGQDRQRGALPILARLGSGDLTAAPPPVSPEAMATNARVGLALAPADVTATSLRLRRLRAVVFGIAAAAGLIVGALGLALAATALVVVGLGAAAAMAGAAVVTTRNTASDATAVALRDDSLSSATFAAREPAPDFEPVALDELHRPAGALRISVDAFRQAGVAMLTDIHAAAPAPAHPPAVDFGEISRKVAAALDPAITVHAAFAGRLKVADAATWHPRDPIEPLLLGPDLERPMYQALTKVSPRWLFPGIGELERNRVTLLEINSRFVEAFLVGLNHEMGRELLWREFPTDARKTFFRRFWDTRGAPNVPAPPDITPIHLWSPESALGQHAPPSATAERLVLLIHGDVLHRYPSLTVQATRAAWGDSGKRVLGTEEQSPVFQGSLGLDVAFYGFALTHEQAIGNASTPGVGDPGWFFVLAERPGEPRFGLDVDAAASGPATTWSDLAWSHVAGPDSDPLAIGCIDLDTDYPDTRAIADPGGARWHADAGLGPTGARASDLAYVTLQQPVRVAFHAADLLPKPHG